MELQNEITNNVKLFQKMGDYQPLQSDHVTAYCVDEVKLMPSYLNNRQYSRILLFKFGSGVGHVTVDKG